MSHPPTDRPDFPQRVLVYWYREPVFAVARPGVLTYDGESISCIDNDLRPVFGASSSDMTVKKRFGVFRVYIGGRRISYLSANRGLLSPAPSEPLLKHLTGLRSSSGRRAELRGLSGSGRIRGRSAVDGSFIGGGYSPTDALLDSFAGTETLGRRLLTEIGVWKR